MATHKIKQGVTCTIRISGIKGDDGQLVDMSAGWTIRAQARRHPTAPLLAEWVSGAPAGSQGQATGLPGGEVALTVTGAMSTPWTWTTAELHVMAYESTGLRRESRVGEDELYLDPAIVHD